MTPQEIFDKAVDGMLKQGEQSYDRDQGCVYRHPSGLKCAVGHLISDDIYDPEMDNRVGSTSIREIVVAFPVLPHWMRDNVDLLTELQEVHDSNRSWAADGPTLDMRSELRDVAALHGLTFDPSKYTWAE